MRHKIRSFPWKISAKFLLSQDATLSSFYRSFKSNTSLSEVTPGWSLTTKQLFNIKVLILAYFRSMFFFYIPDNPWWSKHLSEYVWFSEIVFSHQMIRPVPKFTTTVLKITYSSGSRSSRSPNMSHLLNGYTNCLNYWL